MNARQMLVNDKARTAYCYVPKAGCTTLKILFFKAQGAYAMCTIYVYPRVSKAICGVYPRVSKAIMWWEKLPTVWFWSHLIFPLKKSKGSEKKK